MPSTTTDTVTENTSEKETVEVPKTDAELEKETEDLFEARIKFINAQIEQLREEKKELRKLQKNYKKCLKNSKKKVKRQSGKPNKAFLTPVEVTPALLKFLNLPAETLISRTDATKAVTQWIKDNGVQDEGDGRNINIDDNIDIFDVIHIINIILS